MPANNQNAIRLDKATGVSQTQDAEHLRSLIPQGAIVYTLYVTSERFNYLKQWRVFIVAPSCKEISKEIIEVTTSAIRLTGHQHKRDLSAIRTITSSVIVESLATALYGDYRALQQRTL